MLAPDPQARGSGAFREAIPPLPPKPRQSLALKRPTPRAVDRREGRIYMAIGYISERKLIASESISEYKLSAWGYPVPGEVRQAIRGVDPL